MKNFQNYKAAKYDDAEKFVEVEDGIYRTADPYMKGKEAYVTSLTFELEDDELSEGSPSDIPQTPFEDLLDEFLVAVYDFYEEENAASETTCYQEFGSSNIEDIRKLRTIIGKRFYAVDDPDREGYYTIKIEDMSGARCDDKETAAESDAAEKDEGSCAITTEETNANDFEFEYREDYGGIITCYLGGDKEVVIPAEIDGKRVRAIGADAFCGNKAITSVVISDGVAGIGHRAFQGCKALTSVTIPDSVTLIGEEAFEGCKSLENINVPDSVEDLYDFAFDGTPWLENKCRETSLVIIGGHLYYGRNCKGNVEIPDGVTHICLKAFYYCRELTGVKIPESVTEIGRYAFQGCSALEDVETEWGLKKISEGAFRECSALKEIKLLRSVTEIGEDAFYGCTSLKKVDLPSELAAIADFTFAGCSSLDFISIPDSVTEIGKGAFRDCAAMRWVRLPDDLKIIPRECFRGCASLEEAEIPDGLQGIGAEAYKDCAALKTVYLPEGMTAVGCSVFANCTALEQIWFEDGLRVIGSGALQNCSSLEKVELPDTLQEIKDMAFAGCVLLEKVELPDTLQEIKDMAFAGCVLLEEVEIPDSVVKLAPDAFMGCRCTVIYKGEEFSSERLNLDLKMINVICEDGVFKAKGSFSLGILGTFVNNDYDDEQIQFDEDLLDAILDEDDFCEPFLPRIKSDDPDAIAKVLTEYYSQKARDVAANAKQISDCILYHLFADMEGCHYPFWEIPDAVLPGFLENHSKDDLESVVYCHANGGIQSLYEYFDGKPNNGTMEKPDVEELIRRLYPMFDLDGFIKSFKREELHFNGEYLSFQFSDGWGAKIACAAYDELDENFTSTDWHND